MLKATLIIFVFILTAGIISCQENINSGLVAHYPFNGNADDQSGNENHGVIEGAVLTKDRFDNANSAYNFDGLKATIVAKVKDMPDINSPQSFSWWYKIEKNPTFINEQGADNMIALVDSVKGIGIQFGFRAPGYESLGFDTWNWGGGTLLEAERPAIGKWYHCVYTYDGKTHRFYINRMEISNSTANTQDGIPTILMFGNYPGGDQFFDGILDDIRIYNRRITQDEINVLYNEGK